MQQPFDVRLKLED